VELSLSLSLSLLIHPPDGSLRPRCDVLLFLLLFHHPLPPAAPGQLVWWGGLRSRTLLPSCWGRTDIWRERCAKGGGGTLEIKE